MVQAGKGYAITARTMACSIYAEITLVITHPFIVAGHAVSQNPAGPDSFSWKLCISRLKPTFKAPHRVLVYLVRNHHFETGRLKCPGCWSPSTFTIWSQTDCPPRAPVATAVGNYMTILWLQTEGEQQCRVWPLIQNVLSWYMWDRSRCLLDVQRVSRELPCDGTFLPLQPPSLDLGTTEYSVVRLEEKQ